MTAGAGLEKYILQTIKQILKIQWGWSLNPSKPPYGYASG